MSVRSLAKHVRGLTGLRGRIVGVVLVTTVATLAIASALLLGPLEHSLRNADKQTLKSDLRNAAKPFRSLQLGYIYGSPTSAPTTKHKAAAQTTGATTTETSSTQTISGSGATEPASEARRSGAPTRKPAAPLPSKVIESQLRKELQSVIARTGGQAVVLATPGTGGRFSEPLPTSQHGGPPLTPGDSYDDAARAFRERGTRSVYSTASIDGTEYARAAIPFYNSNNVYGTRIRYVLAVRKSIGEIPDAVRVVTRAFLEAAAAGLGLALILGIALSGRLVARLRRLREAALEVEHDAPLSAVPIDMSRDEVGDLARSLAAMQQRLQRQEEARRSFVATASHELRTPLTSLEGMLELLDDDLRYGDPDLQDARALLERARAQSRRLGRLAADLLDLSRMDAQVQLRSEPVELGELSRAVLAEFELGADERRIHVHLEERQRSVWALGDPGSIARIVRILVDNGVRVSPPDSEIRIRLRRGQTVTLSVCDQGPGVCEEEREAIFDRFKRGRDTSGQAGFGLGLAIGRELARRMGGELVLEPSGKGGATFTLTLPVAEASDRDDVVAAAHR